MRRVIPLGDGNHIAHKCACRRNRSGKGRAAKHFAKQNAGKQIPRSGIGAALTVQIDRERCFIQRLCAKVKPGSGNIAALVGDNTGNGNALCAKIDKCIQKLGYVCVQLGRLHGRCIQIRHSAKHARLGQVGDDRVTERAKSAHTIDQPLRTGGIQHAVITEYRIDQRERIFAAKTADKAFNDRTLLLARKKAGIHGIRTHPDRLPVVSDRFDRIAHVAEIVAVKAAGMGGKQGGRHGKHLHAHRRQRRDHHGQRTAPERRQVMQCRNPLDRSFCHGISPFQINIQFIIQYLIYNLQEEV